MSESMCVYVCACVENSVRAQAGVWSRHPLLCAIIVFSFVCNNCFFFFVHKLESGLGIRLTRNLLRACVCVWGGMSESVCGWVENCVCVEGGGLGGGE